MPPSDKPIIQHPNNDKGKEDLALRRKKRLAQSLRANLKLRKAQERGRDALEAHIETNPAKLDEKKEG